MALQLEIVTPSMRALQVECDEVRLPGAAGGFGVLPGHTPLLSLLVPGALYFRGGSSGEKTYLVGEGFAEVSNDKVRVLVELAEPAESIDAGQAQKLVDDRKAALAEMKTDDPEYERMRAQLEEAAARVQVAGAHR